MKSEFSGAAHLTFTLRNYLILSFPLPYIAILSRSLCRQPSDCCMREAKGLCASSSCRHVIRRTSPSMCGKALHSSHRPSGRGVLLLTLSMATMSTTAVAGDEMAQLSKSLTAAAGTTATLKPILLRKPRRTWSKGCAGTNRNRDEVGSIGRVLLLSYFLLPFCTQEAFNRG